MDLVLNKYIDGFPYLCVAEDLSMGGILLRSVHEPERRTDFYTLEIGFPGARHRLWLYARSVWRAGRLQGLRFVGLSAPDRRALAGLLGEEPTLAR